MKANEIIARVRILQGEIALQECRVEGFIDKLSEVRLEEIPEPHTAEQIAESRKLD